MARVSSTVPGTLQSTPGSVCMEVNCCSVVYETSIQMAQESSSCMVLNCYWWRDMSLRENCLCESEPFYIDSKTTLALSLDYYFLGSWELVFEKSSFSWHHAPGIRLCCPNNHSSCIDLHMFIFIQIVGYCCHETHAGCSQQASNPAAPQLAPDKPSQHCCSKGFLGHWCQWCSCWVGQSGELAQNCLKVQFLCQQNWLAPWAVAGSTVQQKQGA